MRLIFAALLLLTIQQVNAADSKNTNLIAVGQGISSPTSTSTINYSSGYTSENAVGTVYQNRFRVTGEYDSNDTTKAYGAEVGYGQGQWGIAVGHRKPDCDGCKGATAGAVGVVVSGLGIGFRFAENISAVSLLFNPQGEHRVGIMAELNTSGGSGNNVTAYGFGYSYVASQFTFTVDASGHSFEDKTIKDDRLQVTPGIMLRADIFQFTVNDKITLNKDKNNSTQDDRDHDVWFGAGLGGDKWHIAAYSKYVNDFAAVATLFF